MGSDVRAESSFYRATPVVRSFSHGARCFRATCELSTSDTSGAAFRTAVPYKAALRARLLRNSAATMGDAECKRAPVQGRSFSGWRRPRAGPRDVPPLGEYIRRRLAASTFFLGRLRGRPRNFRPVRRPSAPGVRLQRTCGGGNNDGRTRRCPQQGRGENAAAALSHGSGRGKCAGLGSP